MSLETEKPMYTIKTQQWEFKVEKSLLKYSFVLKNLISDTEIENDTIQFPHFDITINDKHLEHIFEYVKEYDGYNDDKSKLTKFCFSIIEKNPYYFKNYGEIMQIAQFLQIDCLSKFMEDYLTMVINDMSDVKSVCDMFGWKGAPIHPDLEWTTQSNDW